MAETLGTLCDKLSIVKLKQYHSEDTQRLASLGQQEKQLQDEINQFVGDAVSGATPLEKLTFKSNKVYKKEGNDIPSVAGSLGAICSHLADANCRLWHVQEKVYDFEKVPVDEKDYIAKQLAVLNLERTSCIDEIDQVFRDAIQAKRENAGK